MKTCKKIEVNFENCEIIDITNAIGDFNMEGLTTSISRVAMNCISNIVSADLVQMQIYLDGELKDGFIISENVSLCERLTHKDIVSLNFTYEDDTEETVYVNYGGDADEYNPYQTSKIGPNGDLYIVISKDKTVDDIYTDEVIKDLETAKNCFMDDKVRAKNNLRSSGWKITWQGKETFQAIKNNIIITLSNSQVIIHNLLDYDSPVVFTSFEFKDLCSVLFHVLRLHNIYDKTEYKWLRLGDMTITENPPDEYITISIPRLNGEIKYLKTLEDTEKHKMYTGEVIFNNINILANNIIDMMWIYSDYLDDDFWRRY